MPPGGKELYCGLWRRLCDTGLAASESTIPQENIYYSTLRRRMLPSGENFPRQRPELHSFCCSHPYSAALSFTQKGVTGTSGYFITCILLHSCMYTSFDALSCDMCGWSILQVSLHVNQWQHIKTSCLRNSSLLTLELSMVHRRQMKTHGFARLTPNTALIMYIIFHVLASSLCLAISRLGKLLVSPGKIFV